jgi:hypothetical protein
MRQGMRQECETETECETGYGREQGGSRGAALLLVVSYLFAVGEV